ncbi:hypothetical protein CPB85DRAFT_417358 [Mucidula mucida]|nr:hypothetical protein CPB85DRAFT_417358 [Mucidula mucida]
MSSGTSFPTNVTELTGPLLLGHLFNWGLFGILCVQAYIYYLAFPNDRLWPTKALTIFVFILELAQTVVNTRDAFRHFGFGWGDSLELDLIVFYAWRIWILTGRFWIPGAILLFSLTQCVAGMYAGDCANRVQYFSVLQSDHTTHVVISLWLAGTALCDTVIAVAMSWTLLRARTGVRSTDVIVVKIVRLSIETGTICAICALLDLSFYLGFKNNNYYTLPSIALTKLYSNSFFAVLNSRAKISATQKGGIVGAAETGSRCTCGASAAFESLEIRWRRSSFTVAALTALDVERTQASQISPPASSDGL